MFAMAGFFNLFAQAGEGFGVKAGLNLSSVVGDAYGVAPMTSFHLGVFYLFKPVDEVGIMPELVYSMQGTKTNYQPIQSVNYNYINLPVMINFYPTDNVFLQVGPQFGYLASSSVSNKNLRPDFSKDLTSFDFAFAAGLGLDFDPLMISLRINRGLTTTSKFNSGNYLNNVIQLSVGMRLVHRTRQRNALHRSLGIRRVQSN